MNYLFFRSLLTLLIPAVITSTALAQKGGGGGGSRFSAGAMLLMAQGTMGNGLTGSSNAADRKMLYTPIGVFLGFNIKRIRLGLNYEYSMVGQMTEPAEVSGTNLSGTNTSLGVRLEYYDGKNAFGIVYRLSDAYKLDKQTFAGGPATEYKGSGGISIQFMRQIKNKIGLVIDYSMGDYKDSLPDAKVKWNRMGLGIVFSNFSSSGR